jgi:hypothetical protein
MKKLKKNYLIFSLVIMTGFVHADVPLKEVSSTLLVGGDALTRVIWAACIVVGIMLIAAAFTQFQIHRRNPKLVPLTTPVMYLILGVAAIAIPFTNRIIDVIEGNPVGKGTTPQLRSAPGAKRTQPQQYNPNDIDAPLN